MNRLINSNELDRELSLSDISEASGGRQVPSCEHSNYRLIEHHRRKNDDMGIVCCWDIRICRKCGRKLYVFDTSDSSAPNELSEEQFERRFDPMMQKYYV